jgi:hypothetical protein
VELPGLGDSQRRLLATLQAGRKVADYDDYREDAPAEREGFVAVESRPGESFRAVMPRTGLRQGLGYFALVLLPFTAVSVYLFREILLGPEDPVSLFLFMLGWNGFVLLAWAALLWFMLLTEEITVRGDWLVRRWTLGPFVHKRALFLDVIKDVVLGATGDDERTGKVYKALYVTAEGDKLRLGWAAETNDLRYLRAELLAFLRSVTASGFGRKELAARGGAGAAKVAVACPSCSSRLELSAVDFWRGFASCPQCRAALRLGDAAAPTPAQKQALAEAEVFPVKEALDEHDDDAFLPTNSLITADGEPGGLLRVVQPRRLRERIGAIVSIPFSLAVIGAFGALAFRENRLAGTGVGLFGLAVLALRVRGLWGELSHEEVLFDREALIHGRFLGAIRRARRYGREAIRGFGVAHVKDSEGHIEKALLLDTATGPVTLFSRASDEEVLYLRAQLAQHLRSLEGPRSRE